MKKIDETDFRWHELDPDVGGYLSVHIGKGHDIIVLTTPISHNSRAEHEKLLKQKIQKL